MGAVSSSARQAGGSEEPVTQVQPETLRKSNFYRNFPGSIPVEGIMKLLLHPERTREIFGVPAQVAAAPTQQPGHFEARREIVGASPAWCSGNYERVWAWGSVPRLTRTI